MMRNNIQGFNAPSRRAIYNNIIRRGEGRTPSLEEFIEYTFPQLIGGDIFVSEGRVRFWGLMACLRDEAVASLVPVGKAYPSGLPPVAERRLKDISGDSTRLGAR